MKTLILPAFAAFAACLPLAGQATGAASAAADPLDRPEFRAAIVEAVALADRHTFGSLRTDEVNAAGEIVDSRFRLPGYAECYLDPHSDRSLECSVSFHGEHAWPAVFAKLEALFATLPNLSRTTGIRRSSVWVDQYRSTGASRVSLRWDASFLPRVILIRFTSPEPPKPPTR